MTWLLLVHGGIAFAGTRAQVLDVAEERGLLMVATCGAHTGDPAYVPKLLSRDARIVPSVGRRIARRAA